MGNFRLVRNCSHTRVTEDKTIVSKTILRDVANPFDVIVDSKMPNTSVVYILSVRDGNGAVVDKSNYKQYSHDKILWLGNVIVPNSAYFVDYVQLKYDYIHYLPHNCTVCNGFGWYINFLDSEFNTVDVISGQQKMAQEFLKLLLTGYGTDRLDSNYGTKMHEIISEGVDSNAENTVSNSIFSAESYYKQLQLSDPTVLDEEKLIKVIINEIIASRDDSGVYINLTLVSAASQRVSLGFNITG